MHVLHVILDEPHDLPEPHDLLEPHGLFEPHGLHLLLLEPPQQDFLVDPHLLHMICVSNYT